MANIDLYCLPQLKGILGDTGTDKDAEYLRYIRQAVADVNTDIDGCMSVSASGGEYTLSPSLTATSAIWNLVAWRAAYLYRSGAIERFLDEKDGAGTIRDATISISRVAPIRGKQDLLDRTEERYQEILFKYLMGAAESTLTTEEMGLREAVLET